MQQYDTPSFNQQYHTPSWWNQWCNDNLRKKIKKFNKGR